MAFNGESTTDDVLQGIRLDGQHAVVTGATGGLGIETARALASVGASVTITGRSAEKIDAALATLRTQLPEAQLDGEELELASQASIVRIDLIVTCTGANDSRAHIAIAG